MEWLHNIFSYSEIEKELLNEDFEPSIYKRYGRLHTVDGQEIYTVQAPPSNAKKLPKLPTVIMLHGLGGSMQCFSPLAQILNNFCEVVTLDLPGNGHSMGCANEPQQISRLLEMAVKDICGDSEVVLIGHSYGATHALRLALAGSSLAGQVCGIICITPPYASMISDLGRIIVGLMPISIFDVFVRGRDRVGGVYSQSVNRLVAKNASLKVRREQLRINLDASTYTVLKSVSAGSFYDVKEGAPQCPVLIIAAKEDQVCPPLKAQKMFDDLLGRGVDVQSHMVNQAGHSVVLEQPEIVAGLISAFLRTKIDERLSSEWQLSYLASLDNKWSLKNEAKWKGIEPVGSQVGPFKGMKVLRENDPIHSPRALEVLHSEIGAIIDISREAPPYNPGDFNRVKYYKFPTVSKIPPSESDVRGFRRLVNEILLQNLGGKIIGVHCHYGFNRTGFLICSYLIEEQHFSVPESVEAYKESRPPGIRHQHFIDDLYVRYMN